MGIYVFSTDYLIELLSRDAAITGSSHDFGKDIVPTAVREGRVGAHLFTNADGGPAYWRDVGTLDSYWSTHMELLDGSPAMDLYDERWPIPYRLDLLPSGAHCRRWRTTPRRQFAHFGWGGRGAINRHP